LRRRGFIAAALLAAALPTGRPALGEAVLRIVRPLDLTALPLIVMQHERLIERTAEAMGQGAVAVIWAAPEKAAPLDALAAGQADFAAGELVAFLIAADAAGGAQPAIRALGAIARRPYVLVTRNPAVRTVRDFAASDRIAVPLLKVSGPAVMLEMAAAQEWGAEQHDRLHKLAIAQSDATAAAALLADKAEISAHFSRSPYADQELANPAIHRVMDSFDIAGPHTVAVLAATQRFRDANTELCKAVLSALQQAGEFIQKSPGAAAEIYAAMVKEPDVPLEDLSDIIGDPDLTYPAAPAGIMRIAEFMYRIGRLKRRPADWRDLFLPEARDLPGS
jgi:NitT/TauT family transport system substrate-binding protein